MGLMGKICREFLCNRFKLSLFFMLMFLLLLYCYACNLGISHCDHPTSFMGYKLSGRKVFDQEQNYKLNGHVADKMRVNGNHKNHAESDELEIRDDNKRHLERHVDMTDMSIEEWNLDRFYSVSPGSKEKPTPAQYEKQSVNSPRPQADLAVKVDVPQKKVGPNGIKSVSHSKRKFLARSPHDESLNLSDKHVQNKGTSEFLSAESVPDDVSTSNPLVAYLKKKALKSKKKVVPLLPDTFPYFDNHRLPPMIGDYKCRDGMCSEFLSETDKIFYKDCVSKMKMSKNLSNQYHAPGGCHFINGIRRAAVALVSFPGSGNTWVRGLLERTTGVCTGSVYCDNGLRVGGMNGESVRSGTVLVVKTHKPMLVSWTSEDRPCMAFNKTNTKMPSFGSAILIVRNPFKALVAEWSRTVSADNVHTSQVNRSVFGENPYWEHFIQARMPKWQDFFQFWVVGRKSHRVLVIRYEHLKEDMVGTIKKILDFLKFPYNEKEVEKKLGEDFGLFKRPHRDEFEHFTENQKKMIRQALEESLDYLQENNGGETFGIEEYLLSN